ncbi:hypothetical protein BST11_22770 [Mycobacterium alsense]|uniref:Uncharacterized protein n=1 Tax=Mycobacterium alsense TaxID=324058 RepID=A0ABX3R397_9MYCO|nr:hypothetical protein [Mycobacterium alsense]OQZ88447.1 hypothetical protein BST11_22770 [Mycobacterium alsense]
MARNGPPEDFHNQQTQYADYGAPGGPPPPGGAPPPAAETPPEQVEPPEAFDAFGAEPEPTPWYRRPAGIIAWVVAVLTLLALIVYGLMQLIQGGQGTGPAPSTSSTTPATTTPTSSAPSATTTPQTTPSSEPPTSSAVEPPAQQPTQQPTQRPTQQPTHRHHLPPLPPVITIPGVPNPVTLPPGLR